MGFVRLATPYSLSNQIILDLDNPTTIANLTGVTSVFNARVPEPGSMTLLGLGLVGVAAIARRRKAGVKSRFRLSFAAATSAHPR